MKKLILAASIVLAASSAFAGNANISGTKHNLSSLDTNTAQICVFCHTPHNASSEAPLWNRNNSTTTYKPYASGTLNATISDTTIKAGISAACLSCHDNVQALGSFNSTNSGATKNTTTTLSAYNVNTTANLGNDLSNDHPVGFNYANAQAGDTAGIKSAGTVAGVAGMASALSTGNMECSSCHIVHDNTNAPFLRISNNGSNLCLACHTK